MNEVADTFNDDEGEEDVFTDNRTPAIRRALKALGRAKRSNKAKWKSGKKSGFKVAGKSISRATFAR